MNGIVRKTPEQIKLDQEMTIKPPTLNQGDDLNPTTIG